jgi:type II secretory pathway pseudopilin PulG
MRATEDLTFMHIEGQGSSRLDDRGFLMVVLLVVIAVTAVGMTAMLPTWKQQAIREKEEELIFRGQQYARALVLYSRKNNNLLPTSVDALYDGKYLRKKWKDPITGEDFGLLAAGQPGAAGGANPFGVAGGGRAGGQPAGPGGGRSGTPTPPSQPPGGARGTGPGSTQGTQFVGSIQGVYSTSTDTSIKVYQNQQRYIDWQFTVQTAMTLMGGRQGGAGLPGRGGGDGRGGGGDGGRGGIGVPGRGGLPGRGGAQPGAGRGGGAQPPGRGGATPIGPGGGRRGGGG